MHIKKINDEEIEVDGVVHKLNEKGNYEVKIWKRWRAKKGECYFYLDSAGGKSSASEINHETDNYRYNTGNYFQTEEQVEAKEQYDISSQKIKDSAEGFVGNWKDDNEEKYFIIFDWDSNSYKVRGDSYEQNLNETYFETVEQAEKCIDENEAHLDVVRDYKG